MYGKALQSMVNPDLHKHDIDKGLIIKSRKASLFGKLPSDEHSFYHHLNSIGRFYDELLESPEDAMNIKNHESYGMIGLSRGHISGGVSLFGSSIKHSEVITLKISKGEVNRSYNRDSFSSRAEIIEIDLSQSQFSELITSFNRGDGTPCTLKTVNGKRMEEPPFVSKVQQSQIEFQNRMSNLEVRMENLVSNVKEILENTSDKPGIFDKPLYNKFQLGIGNIPEKGLERILELV